MTSQPRLFVHRRAGDQPGDLLGEARLIWPRVAQVLPPLDDTFGKVAHHADDLVAVTDDDERRVLSVARLRPAKLSFAEAERLAEQHGAAGIFTTTARFMVALELSEPYAAESDEAATSDHPHPGPPPPHDPGCPHPHPHPGPCRVGEPWWCKVFCVSGSCDNC